jgi:hypothetical protein
MEVQENIFRLGQSEVKRSSMIVRVLQALLISAVLVAPALGRVHQFWHAQDFDQDHQAVLFSEHQEGSLSCLALDHLGSGEAPVSQVAVLVTCPPVSTYRWVLLEKSTQSPAHFFSARAPPCFL